MEISDPPGLPLKLVWVRCLLLGSPLICMVGARDIPEARNGQVVSAFHGQQQQLGKEAQGQQAHSTTLVHSQSEVLVVEPRAYPADSAPPQPYGYDYLDPLSAISTTADGSQPNVCLYRHNVRDQVHFSFLAGGGLQVLAPDVDRTSSVKLHLNRIQYAISSASRDTTFPHRVRDIPFITEKLLEDRYF
ncbi:uncharacterized protein PpBr36_09803 [Pyricularia pennisetigena]|uniref:uncharacterized protein n=1 Tax=Pyricularia pennisetigena TaxID=1578925 RepID=UPI00114E3AE9|nr:uncharacterized protein PpBr36_09803 [Pyricularia pennisetigena]TLS22312.1 hypothetical protein PpBr36_09803 [Pyricularia pennisetigena]